MRILLIFIVVISSAFYITMLPPHADQALVNAPQAVLTEKASTFTVDTAASTVIWTGTKPSGKHVGAVSISQGTLELKKKNIKSGNFTINMSSITDTDLQGKSNSSLVGHLKSADFFDVEKFPTAVFELTGISELEAGKEVILDSATHTVSGNFTMKGIKQNISFPANITVTGSQVRAKANFNLDRTLWGVNYGTANGKVSNDINLKLDITANK